VGAVAAARPDVTVTPTREQERPAIEGILRRAGVFREAEVAVALEVLDVYLHKPGQQDYQVYTASRAGVPAGYVCFGRNTMTEGTFELYWIAVDPEQHRHGIGRSLMTLAEYEAARQGGRMVVVETSSREDYHGTRKFYHGLGYRQAALVPDYYAVGDGKVILTKKLPRPA
jgi:ribosomal protein S18 acetylase RimI-like enzyme